MLCPLRNTLDGIFIMKFKRWMICLLLFTGLQGVCAQEKIPDTQVGNEKLMAPAEALKSLRLPDGFSATLFAHEPAVIQPIGMSFDSRGRLWISECLTYAETKLNFDLTLKDRVVILEDTDGDGLHDKRKVFWDQGQKVTSALPGFGGVWVLAAPKLLFIPDRDGDDKPDGEPEVVLDGFDAGPIRHNIVNGLAWGPDGWLYGRHGIQATSFVGPPDTPASRRVPLNCGIWRYHPTRKVFEVVSRGTTNSWGHDWDANGECFFINTVIGHFWHAIPGSYLKRMYGEHFNPRLYELIDQHADHFHWDRAENWSDVRQKGVTPTSDKAGGGHAHCGFMIYQGDNWPEKYRGKVFTVNFHGRRINSDRIEPHGNGFLAKHEPDFMHIGDPWFRGIELAYGPDGGVFLLDWSDTGECHENDGVHRNSGRIYKIVHGKVNPLKPFDLAKLSDLQLAQMVKSANEWHYRQARRILQERASGGAAIAPACRQTLLSFLSQGATVQEKLRALWMLNSLKPLTEEFLLKLLEDAEPAMRTWAVRLLMDGDAVSQPAVAKLQVMASREQSPLVRLYLASALHKIPLNARGELALALAKRTEDANDHNQPLMIWHGAEPLASARADFAVRLALESRMKPHARFASRVLAEEITTRPTGLAALLQQGASRDPGTRLEIALGMRDGMRGLTKATPPASWQGFLQKLNEGKEDARQLGRELAVVFGDGRALAEIRKIALDGKESAAARQSALQTLVDSKAPDLAQILPKLIGDRVVAEAVVRGLAAIDLKEAPNLILGQFDRLEPNGKKAAIDTLCSRPAYALALLKAIQEGKVQRLFLTGYHARQIAQFNDPALSQLLTKAWGEVRLPSEKVKLRMASLRQKMTPDTVAKGNPSHGRALFNQVCANCHGLFGQGGNLGPDLTGSQRSNLEYLLENILEPNATVAADFRMSAVAMKDGRLITGLLFPRANNTVELVGPTEKKTVSRDDIESIRALQVSPMPENLFENLKEEQIRDLFSYLMGPGQVALP